MPPFLIILRNVSPANIVLKHSCKAHEGEAHLQESNDLVLWTFHLHNPLAFPHFLKVFDIFFSPNDEGWEKELSKHQSPSSCVLSYYINL